MAKVYTAQEMRNCADNCDWRINPCVAEMLRQAAEMRERLDELLLDFHSCPDERDLFNYILRGDAGKEGK